MTFDQFDLHPTCLDVLQQIGIVEPTPVQAESIPVGLEGSDVLAIAQTGTGKTLAFSLPALTNLAESRRGGVRMLVLTPTRELAKQVEKGIAPFAKALGLRSACIYGGVGMGPQANALRRGFDIIVATPGRLIDHMDRGDARFDRLTTLVLDEADRMLDMGFLPAIRRILSALPKERQTMFFSATFPVAINRLANEFQNDAVRIEIQAKSKAATTVHQQLYTVEAARKKALLQDLVEQRDVESAIVFVGMKYATERIAKQLAQKGIAAQAIHGGRSQAQRERALEAFRRGKCRVLVATDVAARGIDVQGVTHVINFDVPKTFDDYVHRIGRTGRAEAQGEAITLVTPQDLVVLGAIEKGLGRALPRAEWDGAVNMPSLYQDKPAASRKRFASKRRSRGLRNRRVA